MSATVNALKQVMKGLKRSIRCVDEADYDAEYEDPRIYPIFTKEEQAELVKLRREAWNMRPFLGLKRLEAIHEDEVKVGNDAMETDNEPFEMVKDHWLYAIDLGKKLQEHSLIFYKTWMAATKLIDSGLETHAQMAHFINLAAETDVQGVYMSMERLNEITRMCNEAFLNGTNICMCKMKNCCCRV